MLLLFLALFTVCGAEEYWETFPERRSDLSEYQDATKSLAMTSKRYLMYRSYEKDKAFGAAYPCVSIQEKNQTCGNTSAQTVMMFYNTTSTEWVTLTVPSKAVSSNASVYTIPNVIRAGAENRTADSPIIYSDYNICDVVRAPHTGNDTDCELWVVEDRVTNYPTYCDFIYKLLCAPQKYDIYQGNCSTTSVTTDQSVTT